MNLNLEEITDLYKIEHGEDQETINSTEEMALEFAFVELMVLKKGLSLEDLTDAYREKHGEKDGEGENIIDFEEENALEFVLNKAKNQ